jgi:hypothetical protein
VLANKQDIAGAKTPAQVATDLKLNEIRNRHVRLFGTSGITGEGLNDALDWVSGCLGTPPPPGPFDIADIVGPPSGRAFAQADHAPAVAPAVDNATTVTHAPPARPHVEPATAAAMQIIASAQPGASRALDQIAPRGQAAAAGLHLAIDKLGPESGDDFLTLFAARDPVLLGAAAPFHVVRLRLIHAQLVRLGRRAAVKVLHKELEALFASTGRANHVYHCTIVYFWLQIVDYFLAVDGAASSTSSQAQAPATPSLTEFVAFVAKHSELLQDSELLAQYYTVQRIILDSTSFSTFLLPDVKPLPSLLTLK